jgi:hypothetical protein
MYAAAENLPLSVQDGKIVLWEIFLLPMSLKEI